MKPLLRAGIIAAGDGARLKTAYPDLLKPLIPVGNRPLSEWIIDSLRVAGVRSIVVLFNSRGRPVREHLRARFPEIQWTFLEKDTASSWESFRLVSRALSATSERFLISTIDALIPPADAARFVRESALALQSGFDAALALTGHVDDEKPLWAELDSSGRVIALGDASRKRTLVTSGLYALTRGMTDAMPAPQTYSRLRDYWAAAIEEGRRISGIPLSKTLDVDRPEDVAAAREFLAELGGPRA